MFFFLFYFIQPGLEMEIRKFSVLSRALHPHTPPLSAGRAGECKLKILKRTPHFPFPIFFSFCFSSVFSSSRGEEIPGHHLEYTNKGKINENRLKTFFAACTLGGWWSREKIMKIRRGRWILWKSSLARVFVFSWNVFLLHSRWSNKPTHIISGSFISLCGVTARQQNRIGLFYNLVAEQKPVQFLKHFFKLGLGDSSTLWTT